MNEVSEKQHAHEIIDRLADSQIATAVRFLEFMLLDPVARALAIALSEDEAITEPDRRRFHEGQAWFERRGGKGISMEEVLSEFGVKPADFQSSTEDAQ